MLGVVAQRIAWPIRKPRNNADECHCAETRRDGAFRAICFVAPLARGACHGLRVASRISSRKASVAATRDRFRGSLMRVGLFVTCLVDLMRPSIGFAAIKLLEAGGADVYVPPDQTCCGQPGYNSGDRAGATALAAKVVAEFESC